MINASTTKALLGLHAQTALHPGSGAALGTVDLPVQRERHTQWPTIASSALKGVLRDAVRERIADRADLNDLPRWDDGEERAKRSGRRRADADATLELNHLFGPPTAGSDKFAGALSVTDARLLAYPVRSLKGVFAWVSCPQALERLQRDAHLAGVSLSWSAPMVADNHALVATGCPCLIGQSLVLEEFDIRQAPGDVTSVSSWVARRLLPQSDVYAATRRRLESQLVVLSDNDFTHFVRHATEVTARVGLNYDTKTVKQGALFYQEFLPAETLFYSVVLVNAARSRSEQAPGAVSLLKTFREHLPEVLQLGGDETTGKGLCTVHLCPDEGGKS